jgi:transposase
MCSDSGRGASPNWVIRKAIEAAGAAVCFLPAYGPDLDPIEQVFAKLKSPFKSARGYDARNQCVIRRMRVHFVAESIGIDKFAHQRREEVNELPEF